MIVGVSIEEQAQIRCEIDADPNRVVFSWQFNNTAGESIKIPNELYRTVDKTNSELAYKPLSELDYGTLVCWADNAVGRQLQPCVYRLIPACTFQTR